MAESGPNGSASLEIPALVYRLCSKLSSNNKDSVSKLYVTTMTLMDQNEKRVFDAPDRFYIIEKIKSYLKKEDSEKALMFEELFYRLDRSGSCKKALSMALFLFEMSKERSREDKLNLLPPELPSLDVNSQKLLKKSDFIADQQRLMRIGSLTFDQKISAIDELNHLPSSQLRQWRQTSRQPRPTTMILEPSQLQSSYDVNCTEIELLREILFSFQGLNGRILVQNASNDGRYKFNGNVPISPSQRQLVLRLTGIGWLFNKIQKYCESTVKNDTLGTVCQSFAAALQDEIQLYYRLVTFIEQELHACSTSGEKCRLTLLRLQVYIHDYLYLFKVLTKLIESCKKKRGGALVNVVYAYNQHGDRHVRQCMTRILRQVVLPIRQMLSQWIFHGEIEDHYKEFFIVATRTCADSPLEPLWHEKYALNASMLPGFISLEQAKKILATGKAVNLLTHIFENSSHVEGYDVLRRSFESTEVELLFNDKRRNVEKCEFQALLQRAYEETSAKALQILFQNYRFIDHLKGLRKFMLLGQGDFIRHLMDLLALELQKPASNLKLLNLKNLLNSAIRATNAQFLDENVTERLDVRFSDSFQKTGWDIFILDYQTAGPISTILTHQCMSNYSGLFRYLWLSKRMEYVLVSLWKSQIVQQRHSKVIPALTSVFHACHMLQSEMMHFIQQMQYYIEFEVLECCWSELLTKIMKAKDIDQLIEAHEKFLLTVISRCMLDTESQALTEQLGAIYDGIIRFQTVHDSLFKQVDEEVSARRKFDAKTFVGDESDEVEKQVEDKRRQCFETRDISDFRIKIQTLTKTYQTMVLKFLLLLANHRDPDIRFLSFRLDFNEHYARKDHHLETSFTFSKHRSSFDCSLYSK